VLPVLKLLGICSILTCVAWLGQRSQDTTTYGPEIATPVEVPRTPERVEAPLPPPEAALPAPTPPPCTPVNAPVLAVASSSALLPDGRLVLNEANADELDRLPGIGKKRADDIVALRAKLGRFKRLTDLLRVRGIGPRSLEGLKEHLVLDRPVAPPADAAAPRVIPVVATPVPG
jgi:competence protein ComEA